jgi:hypothetical protein
VNLSIPLRMRTRKEILTDDLLRMAMTVAKDFLREQGARHGSTCTCDIPRGYHCALCKTDR